MRLHAFPQIMNFSIILLISHGMTLRIFHKLNCNVNFYLIPGEKNKKLFEIQNRQ